MATYQYAPSGATRGTYGIAGLAFGYLYWTRGLEAAILAHSTTDIMGHVIAPLAS